MYYYLKCIREDYLNFSGRSERKEFWYFFSYHIVFSLLMLLLDQSFFDIYYFTFIYSLVLLPPLISVLIRRLHDVNKNSLWSLMFFVPPFIFYILYLLAKESPLNSNEYGPSPTLIDYQKKILPPKKKKRKIRNLKPQSFLKSVQGFFQNELYVELILLIIVALLIILVNI